MGRNSRLLLSALLAFATTLPIAAQAAAPPTVTTLTLSSPSVSWHAQVTHGFRLPPPERRSPRALSPSAMLSGPYTLCEDTAIVGNGAVARAQARRSHIIPAIGAHKYTAIFNGTNAAAASTSASQTLTVTGLYPTTPRLRQSVTRVAMG